MRTLIVVTALVAMALATAASFVVRAEGGATRVKLEHRCTPPDLPSGIDTLVTCTFVVYNAREETLKDVFLGFQPSGSLLIPDAYYFFRATHDGVELDVNEGQLTYPFGDIAPGGESTLEVQVIVRSDHPYAADAVLMAGAEQMELERVTLSADVDSGARVAMSASFVAGPVRPDGTSLGYLLRLENADPGVVRDVTVDLAIGFGATVVSDRAEPGPAPHLTRLQLGEIQGAGVQEVGIPLEAEIACAYAHPAAAVTAADAEGRSMTAAAIASEGVQLTECDGAGQGGGGDVGVLALPTAGDGPVAGRSYADVVHLLLLIGALAVMRGIAHREDP